MLAVISRTDPSYRRSNRHCFMSVGGGKRKTLPEQGFETSRYFGTGLLGGADGVELSPNWSYSCGIRRLGFRKYQQKYHQLHLLHCDEGSVQSRRPILLCGHSRCYVQLYRENEFDAAQLTRHMAYAVPLQIRLGKAELSIAPDRRSTRFLLP